jgi:hypothetical protein
MAKCDRTTQKMNKLRVCAHARRKIVILSEYSVTSRRCSYRLVQSYTTATIAVDTGAIKKTGNRQFLFFCRQLVFVVYGRWGKNAKITYFFLSSKMGILTSAELTFRICRY